MRAAAVSLVGVIVAIHLSSRGLSASGIGLIIGVGIASSAAGTVMTALRADRWGRRRTLVLLSLLTGAGYAALAFTAALPVLIVVAAVAMLNCIGRDRGPASALEQALLPSTTTNERRTWTLAWYNAAMDSGHAIGALGAALPTLFAHVFDVSADRGHALTFLLCSAAVALSAIPYALLTRDVESPSSPAVGSAAAVDPDYKIPYRVGVGVLVYLGRAYLETGKDTEARQTLERAVQIDNDDPLAHLYLGIAMIKTGEGERGRKEIESGLKSIDDTLEYIAGDLVYGFYWDPGMQIRNDIRRSLAAKLDNAQLIIAGERIGKQFDEEIDKARRDQARGRGGSDSGGGGGS